LAVERHQPADRAALGPLGLSATAGQRKCQSQSGDWQASNSQKIGRSRFQAMASIRERQITVSHKTQIAPQREVDLVRLEIYRAVAKQSRNSPGMRTAGGGVLVQV